MIRVTYEISCDLCKKHISTQTFDCAGKETLIQPSMAQLKLVNGSLLCRECWAPVEAAVLQRHHSLQFSSGIKS